MLLFRKNLFFENMKPSIFKGFSVLFFKIWPHFDFFNSLLREFNNAGLIEHPHEQEFAADARGYELVLNSFKKSYDPLVGTGEKVLAQAGIDLFFTYLIFMESCIQKPGNSENSSHPSSSDRRKKLRDRFWDSLPEDSRKLAESAEKIFDGFAKMLKK